MRKLKLQLEALHVESFETASRRSTVRGTVRGQSGGLTPFPGCIDSIGACQVGPTELGCGDPPPLGPELTDAEICGSTSTPHTPAVTV
jgi:hypothetical protein